jgi:hypothetical protein
MDYQLEGDRVFRGPEPDKLTFDQKVWLKNAGWEPPNVAADILKTIPSGLVKGAVSAPFIGADAMALGARGINMIAPDTFSPEAEQFKSPIVVQGVKELPKAMALGAQNPRSVFGQILSPTGNSYNRDAAGPPILPPGPNYAYSRAPEIPLHDPQTSPGRYADSMSQAMGGMVLGGPSAFKATTSLRLPAAGIKESIASFLRSAAGLPATQAAAVGGAAELGGDLSRGFDTTQEQNPFARGGSALVTALGLAINSFLHKPTNLQPLHEATKELTPKSLTDAMAEAARLKAAGATTQTVGDTLPNTSTVRAIEKEVAANVHGGKLRQALGSRGQEGGDIPNLLGEAKTLSQNAAAPGFRPGSSDAEIAALAHGNRTNALKAVLSKAPLLPESDLQVLVRALEQRALNPENGAMDTQDMLTAANRVNTRPRYPLPGPGMPGPVQGPGVLTGGPSAPMPAGGLPQPGLPSPRLALPAPPTQALAPAPVGGPVALLPTPQGTMPPAGGRGFKFPNTQPITDVPPPQGVNLTGLSKDIKALNQIGVVNPTVAGGKQIMQNSAIAASKAADEELKKLSSHYKDAMEAHVAKSPHVDLAQTLADNKLFPRPNTATSSLSQDQVRSEIARTLAKIDPKVAQTVGEKFHAADTLSRHSTEPGLKGFSQEASQAPVSMFFKPFNTASRWANIKAGSSSDTSLSNLLSQPNNPATWDIIKEISQTNPALADALRRRGMVGAVNASAQAEGKRE